MCCARFVKIELTDKDVPIDRVVAGAERIDAAAGAYTLYRWPGLTDAFLVSVAVVVIGGLVGFLASRRSGPVPRPIGADLVDAVIDAGDVTPGLTTVVDWSADEPLVVRVGAGDPDRFS